MCRRGFSRWLKYFFFPLTSDEDDRRKQLLLTTVLIASFLLGLICLGIVLNDVSNLGSAYRGIPWWIVALVPGWFLFLLVLLRSGFLRLASAGLFLAYLIPSLYSSARWGIDLPQALLSDAFLIVMTSVLFGTRAAFLSSIGIGATLFGFSWLGTEGVLSVNRYWQLDAFTMGDGIAIVSTLLFMSFLCQIANSEIERSLRRARTSEALLRQERDLLELRITERTDELRRTQLEQIMQLQRFVEFGRLATGFFHDLSSPLGALALNLKLMQKAGPKEQKETAIYLERAAAVTGRLENYLQDVRRHLTPSQDGKQFSVTESLTAVLETVEYHAQNAGVTIKCTVDKTVTLTGNAIKFHNVLMNLIWNGIDAYQDMANEVVDKQVIVEVSQTDEAITIRISDHGVGIAPDNLERIWEEFYTTKRPNQGLGIGLTVCKRVIEEDFKGTVSCTSSQPGGTEFVIILPRHVQSTLQPQATAELPA